MSDTWLGLLHAITGRLLAERHLRQDPAPLIAELVADGFEPEAVTLAFAWVERFFAGLPGDDASAAEPGPIASTGLRARSAEELVCVSRGAFGLLLRLEQAGVIDAAAREEILERALALCEDEVSEAEIREISRDVLEAAGRDGSAADCPQSGRLRSRDLH